MNYDFEGAIPRLRSIIKTDTNSVISSAVLVIIGGCFGDRDSLRDLVLKFNVRKKCLEVALISFEIGKSLVNFFLSLPLLGKYVCCKMKAFLDLNLRNLLI